MNKKNGEPTYTRQDRYQKGLDYEQVLYQQMLYIAHCRNSTRDVDIIKFQESVNTLILMLPRKLRKKAQGYKKDHSIHSGMTLCKKQAYDDLWEYINEILEDNNMIFRTSYIKTFE